MKIKWQGEAVEKLIHALHHFKDRNPAVIVTVDDTGTHDTIRVTGDGYTDPTCDETNPDYPNCEEINHAHRCPPNTDC